MALIKPSLSRQLSDPGPEKRETTEAAILAKGQGEAGSGTAADQDARPDMETKAPEKARPSWGRSVSMKSSSTVSVAPSKAVVLPEKQQRPPKSHRESCYCLFRISALPGLFLWLLTGTQQAQQPPALTNGEEASAGVMAPALPSEKMPRRAHLSPNSVLAILSSPKPGAHGAAKGASLLAGAAAAAAAGPGGNCRAGPCRTVPGALPRLTLA
eukprot:jgi/Mesen1/3070/ME000180S02297